MRYGRYRQLEFLGMSWMRMLERWLQPASRDADHAHACRPSPSFCHEPCLRLTFKQRNRATSGGLRNASSDGRQRQEASGGQYVSDCRSRDPVTTRRMCAFVSSAMSHMYRPELLSSASPARLARKRLQDGRADL